MAFTTWSAILSEWKNAIANRNIDSFFIRSVENGREMRTTYNTLGSQQEFTEWLEQRAAQETAGLSSGTIPSAIGGY